jgi:hypothetical protein
MNTRTLIPLALLCALCTACIVPAGAGAHTITYRQAKKAAKQKGQRLAHKRVRLSTLLRESRHRYSAHVKWTRTDPHGCKGCGYDPVTGQAYDTPTTEYCFADLIVRFRSADSRRVVARIRSTSCS